MDILHDQGPRIVVISSSELGGDGDLIALGSKRTSDGTSQRVRYRIDKFPVSFVGTGDLFAALLMAWLDRADNDLKKSLDNVISTMQAVLKRTYQYAKLNGGPSPATLELKLIQSKSDIEEPVVTSTGNVIVN